MHTLCIIYESGQFYSRNDVYEKYASQFDKRYLVVSFDCHLARAVD